jgi:hypothetical protein
VITAPARDVVSSRAWPAAHPQVTVVVSTHNRADLLSGLLDALDKQTGVDAEVVIVDNGSSDRTWAVLRQRCESALLPMHALRVEAHDGPGVPRNTAIAAGRAPLIAFTDDDCLPEPTWLAALVAAFDDPNTVLVQGVTLPEPDGWGGPWGRTLHVTAPSGLYETANLAARREAVEAVGGFASTRLLAGRAFGEDVVLGTAISQLGRFRFAHDAVMRHRVMPGSYRTFVEERWRLRGFPALLNEVPELRAEATAGIFLSRRTAVTDAGVAGVVVAAVTRRSLPLLAAVPWVLRVWRESAGRPGRPRLFRLVQVAVADLVGMGALAVGSARSRQPLL